MHNPRSACVRGPRDLGARGLSELKGMLSCLARPRGKDKIGHRAANTLLCQQLTCGSCASDTRTVDAIHSLPPSLQEWFLERYARKITIQSTLKGRTGRLLLTRALSWIFTATPHSYHSDIDSD